MNHVEKYLTILAGATISCSLYAIASGSEVEPVWVIILVSMFLTLIARISK